MYSAVKTVTERRIERSVYLLGIIISVVQYQYQRGIFYTEKRYQVPTCQRSSGHAVILLYLNIRTEGTKQRGLER